MLRILDKEMIEVMNNLIKNDGKSFYSIWDNKEVDGTLVFITTCSSESYEDAAELLWRDLCEYGGNFGKSTITFVHGNKGFETDELYGFFHYMFDHGHCSFDDALMVIFKHEAGFEKSNLEEENRLPQ